MSPDIAFELPKELEASGPPETRGLPRDGVRLLVSDARTGATDHRLFVELPTLLARGDLLVVNDSATLPAGLEARRFDGSVLALHLSARVANTLWIVEPRGATVAGERLTLPGGGSATIVAPVDARAERLWYARVDVPEPIVEYLHRRGTPIRYGYLEGTYPIAAYQTIFARAPGSAEMPSAGRPFAHRTLAALRRRGVRLAALTLHAGVSSAESHEPPQPEPFTVPHATARSGQRCTACRRPRDRGRYDGRSGARECSHRRSRRRVDGLDRSDCHARARRSGARWNRHRLSRAAR